MGLYSRTLPGFTNGVSQQSASVRRDDQCEQQENCLATIADGLMPRPNTELVDVLGSISSTGAVKFHKINRDVDEKYIVALTNNATDPIRVFDLDGDEKTVQYGTLDADLNFSVDASVKAYLSSGGITSPKKQIKAVSIADYTVIVNNQKTVALDSTTGAARTDYTYAWVRRVYKGEYWITMRWTESSVAQASSWAHSFDLEDGTGDIAQWFQNNVPAAVSTKFDLSSPGSMLYFKPKAASGVDAGSAYLTLEDPYGGEAFIAINQGEVDRLEHLPPKMPFDDVIKIGGDNDEHQDDYYLAFDYATKVWSESLAPGLENTLDDTTMPHRLVRTGASTFTFAPILWSDRTVGDEDTNPAPSFIGRAINNAVFHKNRLWFLSGDSVIGSKASDFFNYFGSTVLDVLDDDPIDIAGGGEEVHNYRTAKGFDKGLIVLADEAQFVLTSGDQNFTPKSVALDPTTAFDIDPHLDPVKIGPDIYFMSPKESYMAIREYGVQPDSLVQDAADITAHVPKYIPEGDILLEACNSLDMLFVNTSGDSDTIYAYKFLWVGNEKVQSEWMKWTFDDTILGMKVFGTVLYLLMYDATNGYKLEKMYLENLPTGSQAFRYHEDHLMALTGGVYSAPSTTFTLDMNCGDGTGWTVIDAEDNSDVTAVSTISGTSLTMTGDFSGQTVYVGKDYTATYRFSEWYPKDQKNQAILQGRLQLRTLTLSFKDSGYFKIEITPHLRDALVHTLSTDFTGLKVGESEVGAVSLLTGEHRFPVLAKNKQTTIDIISDSYLPFAIQTGAWEATWNMRSKLL